MKKKTEVKFINYPTRKSPDRDKKKYHPVYYTSFSLNGPAVAVTDDVIRRQRYESEIFLIFFSYTRGCSITFLA